MTKSFLISGNANKALSEKIAKHLKQPLSNTLVTQFSDGETRVEIAESVRDQNVFIIQPTSMPANHHIMELLLMIDAARRASAKHITAVIPYFGYARQDKRLRSARVPVSARVIADLLTTVGVDHIITVDLHAEQIQGFFTKPIDNLYTTQVFIEDILEKKIRHPLVVSPDIGGVVRARAFAEKLNDSELAIIDKRRPNPNTVEVMSIIGNVKDRHCVIIDDMIDTGNTVCKAATALKKQGAKSVLAYVTHAVLSGNAVNNIEASIIDELVVTDTVLLSAAAAACKKIRVHTVAELIAGAIAH